MISDSGLWCELMAESRFHNAAGLFLDRDGVIVEECHYLHRPEDVVLIDGIADAIALANRAGIAVVVVTNQAGIGRGLYDWCAFADVQRVIQDNLALRGAHLDAVLACAYHEDGKNDLKFANHPWRKPNAGMLNQAKMLLSIDASKSCIVGDTVSDIKAGWAAGLRHGALCLTGHGHREAKQHGQLIEEWLDSAEVDFAVFDRPAHAIAQWLSGAASSPEN